MRPNTLAVATKHRKNLETRKFISEALHVWRAKARCNIVPAERLHELFEELKFSPTEKQINEMLQTAKLFARRGCSSFEARNPNITPRQMNGLTFGEFCVLAADLKRFRTQCPPSATVTCQDDRLRSEASSSSATAATTSKPELNLSDGTPAPEVFLGGSCNPTTWRADVAIPLLNELNISFYNPQVSEWTPDLIELEHRAKEKARVLFFVIDSETRASAASIEAANISGMSSQHLVLVLHPYKREQCIFNEPVSPQEYLDLKRNQQLLRELVTRRGLPVLDSIPAALQQTRAILDGTNTLILPQNIASRLISVRRAFDRVLDKKEMSQGIEQITLEQCQCALHMLGYAQNLIFLDNLREIVVANREIGELKVPLNKSNEIVIDFEEFCMLASYLSILQQEINESGCISPIKGTNLPPPPIFLTNTPEWVDLHRNDLTNGTISMMCASSYSRQTYRSNSSKCVPIVASTVADERTNLKAISRDSGTSSPQPSESRSSNSCASNGGASSAQSNEDTKAKISLNVEYFASEKPRGQLEEIAPIEGDEELSDSNDSVFSSGSSIDSILNFNHTTEHLASGADFDLRDIYLGGSCMLRTTWRNEIVIPMLEANNITYHLPQLHESIFHHRSDDDEKCDSANSLDASGNNDSGISITGGRRKSPSIRLITGFKDGVNGVTASVVHANPRRSMLNLELLEASRVLLFAITNETRSLAPMTLAAHCIGLGYNVVLCVQMLPNDCVIGHDKLTAAAVKDYNRGRSYLSDLAKRQDVPVFNDLKQAVECAIEKVKLFKSRSNV